MHFDRLTIALLLTSFSLGLSAQDGIIEGIVKDLDGVSTLTGVTVLLEDTKIGTSTNGAGYYRLENLSAGEYTLVVSYLGYHTLKKEIEVTSGSRVQADFNMVETIATLAEITVTTKGNQGLREVPGSVHYISPREMQQFSYTDVNRTLRSVPGLNIQEEDGFGLRPNIGLRGTGVERSSKITVMEDGVLMAPAPYAAPAAYYFPTIGRMQAVEVLKGSSQIKNGPYTTGGAINLISTTIPEEFSGRFNVFAGSYGSRNLHGYVGNAHQNFAYLVETFQYASDGFKQLDNGGDTGFDKKDFLAKVRINTNPDAPIYHSLTFKIGQVKEASEETYLGLTESDFIRTPYRRYAGSQSDRMDTRQSQLSLTHVARFNDVLSLTTTAYRTDFSRNWYKLDKVDINGRNASIASILDDPNSHLLALGVVRGDSDGATDALWVKANNRSYYAKGIQTTLSMKWEGQRLTHDLSWGARLHQDQIDRFQWIDKYGMVQGTMRLTSAGTPGTESNRIGLANAFASYVQYKLGIGSWTITPGLRFEDITMSRDDYGRADPERLGSDLKSRENEVSVWIPGLGLDYRFNKYASVFGGVHKGFAPPGSKEGTQAEESTNYEVGARYTKNALSGEAVLFFNDYRNLLGTDLAAAGGSGTIDLFNGGAVEAYGIEFKLSYDLMGSYHQHKISLPTTIVYTYTDASFQNDFESEFEGWGTVSSGDQFPYLANHQFTFIFGLEHQKFTANLSGRYTDEMRTMPGQGEIPATQKTDANFIIDANINLVLHSNVSLFGSITNLTNEVYRVARRPAGLRPGMPRAFNLGIKTSF